MIPRLTLQQRIIAWLLWKLEGFDSLETADVAVNHPEVLGCVSLDAYVLTHINGMPKAEEALREVILDAMAPEPAYPFTTFQPKGYTVSCNTNDGKEGKCTI